MPVQGFNVKTLVTGATGPELAGEFQEMEFSIKNGTEEYLELGERIAAILDGEIKIEGKLKRGMINLGIVKSCFGTSELKRGGYIPPSPRMTVTANINAPHLGLVGKYRLLNVVIPELTVSMAKGKDVVKNDFSFKAEGLEEV
ncbi:hypothetical protein [Clostridium lundense]|uniref:hypothetical protein n=1 Tax=Clostridium lundense TaxID=319475 RepID=UPI0004889787|nr:hypothetical protein [Clostridium lundense]